MGSTFKMMCADCKIKMDLWKFADWRDDPRHYGTAGDVETWIHRSLLLHQFVHKHNGHRIGFYHSDNGWEVEWRDRPYAFDKEIGAEVRKDVEEANAWVRQSFWDRVFDVVGSKARRLACAILRLRQGSKN